MKVKQLIKELQKVDQNALVVLSSDAEGNNYSVLDEVAGVNEFFDEVDRSFCDEEDKPKSAKLAIVLYPT